MNGADCSVEELALAMHLYNIWSNSSERAAGKWVELARECLRQMDWTSTQTRTITEPMNIDQNKYPGMQGVRITGLRPLTLAPDDWKPREPYCS